MLKKRKRKKKREQHRVLSTSTCDYNKRNSAVFSVKFWEKMKVK